MEKQRIQWVDLAKYFCIMAVMADHSSMMTDALDLFVSAYLNMFSFAAGYVYFHRRGFGRFFSKKLRQLFVPWLAFSTLTIVLAHIYSFNEHESFWVEMGKNLLQIQYFGAQMWYVAALFAAFIPFYFFAEAYERASISPGWREAAVLLPAFALSLLSVCFSSFAPRDLFPWTRPDLPVTLPWHLEYLFPTMFFMLLGYLFRLRWEERFDRRNGWGRCLSLWLLYLLMSFVLPRLGNWYKPVPAVLYDYPRTLVALAALTSLCKRVSGARHMNFVGRNTVIYYGLHGKAESLMQAMMKHLAPDTWNLLRWSIGDARVIAAVVSAWLVSWLLVPAAWIIDRYLPEMAGRRRKTPNCQT